MTCDACQLQTGNQTNLILFKIREWGKHAAKLKLWRFWIECEHNCFYILGETLLRHDSFKKLNDLSSRLRIHNILFLHSWWHISEASTLDCLTSITLSEGCWIHNVLSFVVGSKHEEILFASHSTAGNIKLSMWEARLWQLEASNLEGLTWEKIIISKKEKKTVIFFYLVTCWWT